MKKAKFHDKICVCKFWQDLCETSIILSLDKTEGKGKREVAAGEPGEKRGTTKTLFGYIIYILYTYIMAAQIERGKSVILCVLYMEIRIPHMCMCMRTCIHHVHGLDT